VLLAFDAMADADDSSGQHNMWPVTWPPCRTRPGVRRSSRA
jgi:hypothetical protein